MRFILIIALIIPFLAKASIRPSCIQSLCTNNGQLNHSQFEELSNTEHSNLETVYLSFEEKILFAITEEKKNLNQALDLFKSTTRLRDEINKLSSFNLILEMLSINPWEARTDLSGGIEFEMFGSDEEENKLLKNIILKLFKNSSLFRALIILEISEEKALSSLGITKLSDLQKFLKQYLKEKVITDKLNLINTDDKSPIYYLTVGAELEIEHLLLTQSMMLTVDEKNVLKSSILDHTSSVFVVTENIKSQAENVFSVSKWKNQCRSTLNLILHYGLTEEEKALFNNKTHPDALLKSKIALDKIFGATLSSKIHNSISNLKILIPPTKKEHLSLINSILTEASYKQTISQQASLLIDTAEGFSKLGIACNPNLIKQTLTGDIKESDQIVASYYTVKHYESGLATFIHEFGHAVSDYLESADLNILDMYPIERIRSCLNTNYINHDPPESRYPLIPGVDTLWTEEDWADAFSGYALGPSFDSLTCPNVGYVSEAINRTYDYVSIRDRIDDPHSPNAYRVMNFHAHTGADFPKSCKTEVNSDSEALQFKDCISEY